MKGLQRPLIQGAWPAAGASPTWLPPAQGPSWGSGDGQSHGTGRSPGGSPLPGPALQAVSLMWVPVQAAPALGQVPSGRHRLPEAGELMESCQVNRTFQNRFTPHGACLGAVSGQDLVMAGEPHPETLLPGH